MLELAECGTYGNGNGDITATISGNDPNSTRHFTRDNPSPGNYGAIPATTIALTAGSNPSRYTQPLTFTATVSPVAGGTIPGGTVTFNDTLNGVVCSAVPVSQGSATCTASAQNHNLLSGGLPGIHSITANYHDDINYAPASSSALGQTIEDFSIAASPPLTVFVVPGYSNNPASPLFNSASLNQAMAAEVTSFNNCLPLRSIVQRNACGS